MSKAALRKRTLAVFAKSAEQSRVPDAAQILSHSI